MRVQRTFNLYFILLSSLFLLFLLLLQEFQIFFSVLFVSFGDEPSLNGCVLFWSFDLAVDNYNCAFHLGLAGLSAAHGCLETTKSLFAKLERCLPHLRGDAFVSLLILGAASLKRAGVFGLHI